MNGIVETKLKIEKIKYKEKILKENKKIQYRRLNIFFKEENKKWLKILDKFIVLIIIMSVCTILITNFLVVKNKPKNEIKFYEANKNLADKVGYATNTEVQKEFNVWLYITIYWIICIFIYVWNRVTLINKFQLWLLSFVVIYLGIMVARDFLNDLGLLLGYLL